MPCTYTGSLLGDELEDVREALDIRERMLCALCRQLEHRFGEADANNFLRQAGRYAEGLGDKDLSRWWRAHKYADASKGRN